MRRVQCEHTRTAITQLKEFESRGAQVEVAVVGRKGRDFFLKRGLTVRREVVDIFDKLTSEHGMVMGEELGAIDDYVAGYRCGVCHLQRDQIRHPARTSVDFWNKTFSLQRRLVIVFALGRSLGYLYFFTRQLFVGNQRQQMGNAR